MNNEEFEDYEEEKRDLLRRRKQKIQEKDREKVKGTFSRKFRSLLEEINEIDDRISTLSRKSQIQEREREMEDEEEEEEEENEEEEEYQQRRRKQSRYEESAGAGGAGGTGDGGDYHAGTEREENEYEVERIILGTAKIGTRGEETDDEYIRRLHRQLMSLVYKIRRISPEYVGIMKDIEALVFICEDTEDPQEIYEAKQEIIALQERANKIARRNAILFFYLTEKQKTEARLQELKNAEIQKQKQRNLTKTRRTSFKR